MSLPPEVSPRGGAPADAGVPVVPGPRADPAAASADPAGAVRLEVTGLEVRLTGPARADVVSEVSFAVGSGEVLGLVGESG